MTATPSKRLTLSHRLLVVLGVVSFLYWCVMAALSTRDNIRAINTLYDVHMAHTAKAFLFLMDPDDNALQSSPTVMPAEQVEQLLNTWPDLAMRPDPAQPEHRAHKSATDKPLDPGETYGASLRYQLWRDDGTLLFRSDNAPTTPMASSLGYADVQDTEGKKWRSYVVHDRNHQVRIIISEPGTFRDQTDRSIILNAATPLGVGLPVLFLLLWFSIRRGLLPLASLSAEIAQRSPDNLEPMNVDNAPDEVQPMVSALNGLLERVAHALENERQFTDDAAHQLRTPLAVIQSQLYNARRATDTPSREAMLDKLHESVARAIRVVNQLLALVRLDPQQTCPKLAPVNLPLLAQTVCAELVPLALQRQHTLELFTPPDLLAVSGNADLLHMLLANLLDNAVHYTPPGSRIHVRLEPTLRGVSLSVSDDGDGIAPSEYTKVQQRFYRLAGQHQPGTGLGLAICKRIAELHQTSLTLTPGLDGRGLCIGIELHAD